MTGNMKSIPNVDSINFEDVDILMKQLKKLDRDERVLIGLFFYEQLSVDKIAEILSLESSRVRRKIDRILPQLIVTPESAEQPGESLRELYGS